MGQSAGIPGWDLEDLLSASQDPLRLSLPQRLAGAAALVTTRGPHPQSPSRHEALERILSETGFRKCGCSEQDPPLPLYAFLLLASSRAFLQLVTTFPVFRGLCWRARSPSVEVLVRILGFPRWIAAGAHGRVALGWPAAELEPPQKAPGGRKSGTSMWGQQRSGSSQVAEQGTERASEHLSTHSSEGATDFSEVTLP